MKGHRIERTIRTVGQIGLAAGLAVICLAGVVSVSSAQDQLAALPPAVGGIKGTGAVGLDLHVPDMPFAERPGADKSVRPDRWAWIEGCRRFVDARVERDTAIDWEIGGTAGRAGSEDASYRRRHMLAHCLVSAHR